MGHASSSRREESPSRDSGLSEARSSRRSCNSNDEVCLFSPFHCQSQDPPDVSNSIQNWLSMDTTSRDKHVLHAKHCVLTPYFLFSKEDEYNGKAISWLQQKQLTPKQSEFKLLSDKHISVADCAEEAMDMILSLMNMSGFLYDVFQVVEQTKECHFLSDALNMVKNCHLITVLVNTFSKNVPSNKLARDDTGLIILVLLNQAMNHIQKVGDQTEAFEQCVKDNSRKCDELKIKGNGFFNAKKYNKACLFYSQAIKLRPFDAVLYGNRAQSYLSAAKYREALSDARRAICLNPSWEKGYFRYAKAYYHLGFHDKAIAINHQAQEKCSKKSELIQQALLFTKERSSSPSSQPTIKRQRISSAEVRDLTSLSDEDEGEYSGLPDLIDDDTEDELHEPAPSTKKDQLNITKETSRSTTLTDDMLSCKRVQCACGHCSPRNNTLNMRLKRTSDTVHKKLGTDGRDCNNKLKHKTLSKSGQENPEHSRMMLNEACALSDIGHHVQDDDDECCAGCAVSWTNRKDNDGVQSVRPSVNHHQMHDDDDDTKDSNIRALNNGISNDQTKSRNTNVLRSSSNKQHASELLVPSPNNGSTSPSSCKPLEMVSNNYNMCRDCDEYECGSSSSFSAQGKTNTSGGIPGGEQLGNDTNDDMDGIHSRDHDDDDDDNHGDEPECTCGLCSVHGDDDDDDDQWEDTDDDDDDDSFTDMGMPELDDLSDDDDDEDDEDDDDDDDDDDEDAFFFNPFFHMFGPPPPLPPQLVLGSEILLMALIRQFIEEHSEFQSEDTPPGALPEVIESLIKKKVTKDLLDSSSSCCICQNDYTLDETITCLPCNHVYHGPCITTWLKMHATCPTCRDVLPH